MWSPVSSGTSLFINGIPNGIHTIPLYIAGDFSQNRLPLIIQNQFEQRSFETYIANGRHRRGETLFIAGNTEIGYRELFIAAPPTGYLNNNLTLYTQAPETGYLNQTEKLFIRGANETANRPLNLMIASGPNSSGVMELSICGGTPMLPKEWGCYRRGGVDSSGYFFIGEGITIFINGS